MNSLNPATGNVQYIMRLVLAALLPGTAVFIYQTGWGGVINIVVAVTMALVFEAIVLRARHKPVANALNDYSAVVTGLLLALCLPPLIPWWLPVLGCGFAIVFAKHLYGGLGHNIFNPAMAGYALLLVSFPRDLSLWPTISGVLTVPWKEALNITTHGGLAMLPQWDAITGATALDIARTQLTQPQAPVSIVNGSPVGPAEWINLGFLAGGIWLWYRKVIGWQIPVTFLLTLSVISSIHYLVSDQAFSPRLHLFGGATMLCAFFIATDPVSAAAGNRGRLFYAAGIGLLVWVIRSFGGYPDGVAFAVLLMNCMVPALDYIEPALRRNKSA